MKKKGILLFILMLLLMPIKAFALDLSTSITGVLFAKPGDIIAYDVKINVPEDMTASLYEANLSYDTSVLELKNVTSKDWTSITGNSGLTFSYLEGTTGTTTIATLTFKVKDDIPKQTTSIELKDVKVTMIDEIEGTSISNISSTSEHKINVSIKSTDNTLKDLKIDGITVESFDKEIFEYNMTVSGDTDFVEINATVNNANAKLLNDFGSRKVDLAYGENEVLVKVESESGEVQTYSILITREDNRNTNNSLKEIIINSGKINLELEKNETDYVIKTYKLKELEIDAVAMDPKAKVEIDVPTTIMVGENLVVITVTSEVGEEKIYTVTFDNSDTTIDTKLKSVYIKDIELDFDKNTMVYDVVYNKKYKKGLTIKAVTVSSDDIVSWRILYNGVELTEDLNVSLKPGDKYEIEIHPLGMEEGDESETSIYTINIVEDTRINFYFILEIAIMIVLVILIIVQFIKRSKIKKKELANIEKELNKINEK